MIFGNLSSIVADHYSSLSDETALKKPVDQIFLAIVFVLLPLALGFALAQYVPIWSGFISSSAPVLSVLTGFSINTIILLMRYDSDTGHPYEQKTVQKSKEFTLYSILIGVVIIITLVFGYILTQIGTNVSSTLTFFVTGIIYSLIGHYFLTLLVITHRLWALIHGDVL
jgi:predicted Na+-dependent transporter